MSFANSLYSTLVGGDDFEIRQSIATCSLSALKEMILRVFCVICAVVGCVQNNILGGQSLNKSRVQNQFSHNYYQLTRMNPKIT